jgi:hypothetical protein
MWKSEGVWRGVGTALSLGVLFYIFGVSLVLKMFFAYVLLGLLTELVIIFGLPLVRKGYRYA